MTKNQKSFGDVNHPDLVYANGYTDKIEDLNWSDYNVSSIVKQLLNWMYS